MARQPKPENAHAGIHASASANPEWMALAGALYTKYSEAVGGVAFNGDPLPSWEDFITDPGKLKQSGAWLSAATCGLHEGRGVFSWAESFNQERQDNEALRQELAELRAKIETAQATAPLAASVPVPAPASLAAFDPRAFGAARGHSPPSWHPTLGFNAPDYQEFAARMLRLHDEEKAAAVSAESKGGQ